MNPNDPYLAYYRRQQVGGAISQVFRGAGAPQRGDGIGSFLGGLFRTVGPILRSGATAIGKEALRSGVGFLGDVASGTVVPRHAASERLKQFTGGLKRKADDKLDRLLQGGSGYGSAYKKRRVRRVTPQSLERLLASRSRSGTKRRAAKRKVRKVKRKTTAKRRKTTTKRRKTTTKRRKTTTRRRKTTARRSQRDIFG